MRFLATHMFPIGRQEEEKRRRNDIFVYGHSRLTLQFSTAQVESENSGHVLISASVALFRESLLSAASQLTEREASANSRDRRRRPEKCIKFIFATRQLR